MAMRKHGLLLIIVIFSILLHPYLLINSKATASTGNDDWTMFRNDVDRTGTAPFGNSTNSFNFLWNYTTNGAILSSPAIGNNYVVVGSEDSYIYCLNKSNGELIWRFPTGNKVDSSPAINNERVYIASEDGFLYCLNIIDGTPFWINWIGGFAQSSPAVVDDRVYIGSGKNNLYCFNVTDGTLVWKYETRYRVQSSPAVLDGVVFFATDDFFVYAVNATTGNEFWRAHTGSTISSPTIDEGYVYIGSYDGYVCSLNASTGAEIWRYQTGNPISSSPAVANGNIYVGSEDNNIYCLNASTGNKIWQIPTEYWVWSSPAVAGGNVYVGSEDYNLYCLNASTGAKQWSYLTGGVVDSSPAIVNGVLFFGSGDHNLYALALSNSTVIAGQPQYSSLPWTTITFDAVGFAVGVLIVFAITRFIVGKRKEQAFDTSKKMLWFYAHTEIFCILAILVFSIIFFVNLGNVPLRATDEQTYSQWAFHMVKSGDYLTPWAFGGDAIWIGKPPLTMWLMSLSYQLFGVSNFSSRLISAIFGSLSLVLVFYLGKKLYNSFVGFLSAVILGTFATFYEFARRAMTDVPFIFFVVGSLYFFVLSENPAKKGKINWYAVLSGIFFGLALMTKQIQALLIPLIIFIYLILTRRTVRFIFTRNFTLFWGIAFLVFSPWLIYMAASYGTQFWQWFFMYHEVMRIVSPLEGHSGNYLYYFTTFATNENLLYVVLLPFAAGLCVFNSAVKRLKQDSLILTWILIVLAVFTFAETKLDYYILSTYPAFAIAMSTFIYQMVNKIQTLLQTKLEGRNHSMIQGDKRIRSETNKRIN